MEQLKTCSKCGNACPLDSFHKQASSRDGHGYLCAICRKQYRRNYNLTHREAIAAYQSRYAARHKERRWRSSDRTSDGKKICTKCKCALSLDSFTKKKEARDGLEYVCRTCIVPTNRAGMKKFREAHPEWIKEYRRNHLKELAARVRRWYARNREKVCAKRKAKYVAHPKIPLSLEQKIANKRSAKSAYRATEKYRTSERMERAELSRRYVRRRIIISMPFLVGKDIPETFIEAKRAHLKIHRLIKEKRK